MTEREQGYLFGLWIASMICEINAGPNRASKNSMDIMRYRNHEEMRIEQGQPTQGFAAKRVAA